MIIHVAAEDGVLRYVWHKNSQAIQPHLALYPADDEVYCVLLLNHCYVSKYHVPYVQSTLIIIQNHLQTHYNRLAARLHIAMFITRNTGRPEPV
jgi:hypothetical protein